MRACAESEGFQSLGDGGGMTGTAHHYSEGYAVGLLGLSIEDDWAGYPMHYAAGWDAGYAMWRMIPSYWGA